MYRNNSIQFSRQLRVPYNYRDRKRILTHFILTVYLVGFAIFIILVRTFFSKIKITENKVVFQAKPNLTESVAEEKLNTSTNLVNDTVNIEKHNYYNSIFSEKCISMFEEKKEINNIVYIDKEVTKVQMVSEFSKSSFNTNICFNENQNMITIPSLDVKCIEFENESKKAIPFLIKLSAVKTQDDDIHLYTFWSTEEDRNQIDGDDQFFISRKKIKYCDLNVPKETILELKMQIVLEISWDYSLQKNLCFPNINLIS